MPESILATSAHGKCLQFKKIIVIFGESYRECWQTLVGVDSHQVLFVFDLLSDLPFNLQEVLVQQYNFCVPFVPAPSVLPVYKVITVFWTECVSRPGTSGC